jgi:hypothetical protein
MGIDTATAGRPHRASRAGKLKEPTRSRGKKVEQNTPVVLKNRKHAESEQKQEQEIEVIFQTSVDVTEAENCPGRTRSNPIVYEAMDMLRRIGYRPARMSEPRIPINIIALNKAGSLLVYAVRSKVPVPNAARLRELYTRKVDYLRVIAEKVLERIMIWVFSPSCGWRYYIIYPGGLRYDHDLAALLN